MVYGPSRLRPMQLQKQRKRDLNYQVSRQLCQYIVDLAQDIDQRVPLDVPDTDESGCDTTVANAG